MNQWASEITITIQTTLETGPAIKALGRDANGTGSLKVLKKSRVGEEIVQRPNDLKKPLFSNSL
jgi:hypothetical protein